MDTLNCLIVDDEELARTLLKNYIDRLPQLHLVSTCRNPLEAIKALRQDTIDLIFLDIQMPELTGIEFLRTLTNRPLVIFTTAYSDYALEGYELDVVDYLLKPFSFERFVQAVNRATELYYLRLTANNPHPYPNTEKDYILIKAEHKVHRIKYKDILYIQGMREYVAFYFSTNKILSLNSLKNLEQSLPANQFLRIHKSYIVAIDRIIALEGNQLQIGKTKLPIGASYKEQVLKTIF